MESKKNYVLGIFDDEDVLLKGVTQVREKGVKIEEVFTPFPVHGLEHALGYKRSKLSVAAFLFGITGTSLALLMQSWMMGVDWPMIIGGKPNIPLPSFVPVTFELTVLLAAFGMVGTFLVSRNLKPYGKPKIFDVRSTDDKHVMAIDLAENKLSSDEIKAILQDANAVEVNDKVFED
ncbi:MAG TPA: DUF3341 domain-containing protein [Cytophagales bacterium]|nr:DUF3341 domain-containing protein [Cytophagales bacterium]HAA17871.1 DUF3341 domain-containing protein [Cytophagales bacterium]HAP58207.1 DUF3341 domain-containing protein [Cytophagales bacterium]